MVYPTDIMITTILPDMVPHSTTCKVGLKKLMRGKKTKYRELAIETPQNG